MPYNHHQQLKRDYLHLVHTLSDLHGVPVIQVILHRDAFAPDHLLLLVTFSHGPGV